MYKFYNRKDYDWVSSVEINGEVKKSCYNHNYYVNHKTGQIVLEDCDDFDFFDYMMFEGGKWECLGGIFSIFGLFGDSDDIRETEDGYVELYDD